MKSELLGGLMRMGTVRGADPNQRHFPDSFNDRQQSTGREVARSKESYGNRLRSGGDGSTRAADRNAPGFLGKFRVCNQHAEKRLLRLFRYELVCQMRLLDREAMRDQGFYIDFAVSQKLEKRFHVARLSPAHVANRVIDTFLFVSCVVAAGAVGARNAKIEFLFV